jgi:hypothetical protein
MDASNVQRLIDTVASDFGLPFQVVSIAALNEEWMIVVRDTARRRPLQFSVHDGQAAAIRGAAKHRLEALARDYPPNRS